MMPNVRTVSFFNTINFLKNLPFALLLLFANPVAGEDPKQFNALLFSKTEGYRHISTFEGIAAIRSLANKHHFSLDWHEMSSEFTEEGLKQYQVVIFLNTTGDILNESEQEALQKFVQSGKGFVGIHSAADTEYDWPWYTRMVGRMFHIHPKVQTARLNVEDHNFPGLETTPKSRLWTDEWYEYGEEKTEGLNYLLTVDEGAFDPAVTWSDKNISGKGMGEFHPISWYHYYDGGRAFYTGLGHVPGTYSDTIFLDQLYGGIWWAATGKGISTN